MGTPARDRPGASRQPGRIIHEQAGALWISGKAVELFDSAAPELVSPGRGRNAREKT
ncbi:MAG: hypothetical protein HY921_04645 [Elusimicrobia bacterium]|nr:hypothetical protein [Elusimicrobiota bacterium]